MDIPEEALDKYGNIRGSSNAVLPQYFYSLNEKNHLIANEWNLKEAIKLQNIIYTLDDQLVFLNLIVEYRLKIMYKKYCTG